MTTYKLENIDCATCALKIENGLKKIPYVKNAAVNFATSTLNIETELIDTPELTERQLIQNELKKIEPDVQIKDSSKKKGNNRKKGVLLLIWTIIYFTALLVNHLTSSETIKIITVISFLISYILSGWRVIVKAFSNIINKRGIDENFLMSMATIGALCINAVSEAAGVMLFYSIGQFFESLAVNKSRRAIEALTKLKPDYARLIEDGRETITSPESINPGQIILVKAGERIPLDGEVYSGRASLNTAALTGESKPLSVSKDSKVLAGSIVLDSILTIKTSKTYKESSIAGIMDLVQNALLKKAKTEKFITSFTKYYTPAIILIALLTAAIPPLFVEGQLFSAWLYRALVVLVISCPCALVISVPLGYFAGIGKASSEGILIKGSNYIDLLSKVQTIVFDKTGTLTEGNFKVTGITEFNGYKSAEILELAAITESSSNHHIAKAITSMYGKAINTASILNHKEIAGKGVSASVKNKRVIAGNKSLLIEKNIDIKDLEHYKTEETSCYIAIDGKLAGVFTISDQLKPDSAEAVKNLRKNHIKEIVMLTGDMKEPAEQTGKAAGINRIYSQLLPQDKVRIIEKLKSENPKGIIAFAGDGINDAPVIAQSDIGIAMGNNGTDAAIETADVVLMSGSPDKLNTALQISKKTRKIIIQNVVFALTAKIIFIILGSAGLAGMWEAVFADVGVTLIAVFNTLRITKKI